MVTKSCYLLTGIGALYFRMIDRSHWVESPSAHPIPGKLNWPVAPFPDSKSTIWEFFTVACLAEAGRGEAARVRIGRPRCKPRPRRDQDALWQLHLGLRVASQHCRGHPGPHHALSLDAADGEGSLAHQAAQSHPKRSAHIGCDEIFSCSPGAHVVHTRPSNQLKILNPRSNPSWANLS